LLLNTFKAYSSLNSQFYFIVKQNSLSSNHLIILLLLCLNTITTSLSSQNLHLDSLLNVAKNMEEDTSKVNLYYEIARAYLSNGQTDKIGEYGKKGLMLAQKINYTKGIAYAYLNIANFYRNNRNLDAAISYDKKSIEIMRKLNDKKGESTAYLNIGLSFYFKGNFKNAKIYLEDGIKMKEEIGDTRGIAIGYNTLANMFRMQSNYPASVKYHLKSLKIKEILHDKSGISMSYNNIGAVFYSQGKLDAALGYYLKAISAADEIGGIDLANAYNNIGNVYIEKKQYKNALAYQLKALKVRERSGDISGMANSYNNIGTIYLKEKKLELGLIYQSKAYKIYKQLGDKDGMIYACGGMGNLYEARKNFQKAFGYYTEMLRTATELNYREGIRDAYSNFASVYEQQGQYDKALEYTRSFNTMKDSILNKENLKQVAELSTRYETEKKEKEIILLKTEQYLNAKIIKQQQFQRLALLTGVGFLSILIFSIYRRYKFKQRANITLAQQKEEIQATVNLLVKAQDELSKVVEQQEKLTSILAHDLRTPLRFMSMISKHLKDNLSLLNASEKQKLTTDLSTTSQLTFALADELLTWLSVQKQKFKVIFSDINIKDLLDELEVFFSDIADAQNTQIKVTLSDPIFLKTDERLLKIILRNILDNAIKNTTKGIIELHVTKKDGLLKISIKDNGKGMSQEQLKNLDLENAFRFSFEIKDKLGFQIVKDLTFMINGKIEIESNVGKGTTVILKLPVNESNEMNYKIL
jgi:signal transduction histidine kinase